MGTNLLTGVAPQAGLIAGSTNQTVSQSARSAEGNAAQARAVQQAVSSGIASNPAVIVSLGAGSNTRAPSYGEGKSVDASFEKHAADEKKESDKGGGKKKTTVNVTA